MGLQEFVRKLVENNGIEIISKPVSKHLEISGILKALEPKPVLFRNVKEIDFEVAGNLFASKGLVAKYLGVSAGDVTKKMLDAIENPSKPAVVESGTCQEVVVDDVDLDKLPIMLHCSKDGGNYISSGVIVAKDQELGQNVSFHRCMQIGKNKFSVRILHRHLDEFIERNGGELDVALCVGAAPNILLGGATSIGLGKNELEIANSLENLELVKAKMSDVLVPAECEFVFEGTITSEMADEGPFVDLTGTYDLVRKQRVFEVKKITHRKNALWHALLPGGMEHRVLMGMPKEPTIFNEVNKVCKCIDVNINPGGCSWLHAIVKIKKENNDDGKKAIEAAFKGHKSLKHAFVVDDDIDINDPYDVEWAMATRFQSQSGLVFVGRGQGSSLDPSADAETRETDKTGFDLTIPAGVKKEGFMKAEFPKVDLRKFSGE